MPVNVDLSQFVPAAPRGNSGGFATDISAPPGPSEGMPDLSAFASPAPQGGFATDIGADLTAFVTPEDPSLADELVAGVSSGTDQLQSSMFGLTLLLGRELGIDTLYDIGEEGIARNEAEAASTPVSIQGFTDIESFDDFTRWAAGTIGNAMPSLALAVSGGGVGGILTKKAVETSLRQTIMSRMKRNLLSKGLTEDVADKAIRKAISSPAGMSMLKNGMSRGINNTTLVERGFARGTALGVTGSAGAPIAGDTDIMLTEAGIDAGFTSIVAGLAGGALEILPVARLIDRAFPGVDRAVAKSFIKDFATSSGTQALLEGSTEGAQEIVQLAAMAYHDPTFDMLNATNRTQIINSFAAGALVGAVTGGAADVAGAGTRAARKLGDIGAPDVQPRFNLGLDKGPTPDSIKDFVPADNTFYEEVKGRVNGAVTETIEPVINTVRDQFQLGLDAIATAAPALNRIASKLAGPAKAAQEEFLAGHKPIIDDVTRYAKEQAAFITEEAQHLFGDERKAFVEAKLAEMQEQIDSVAGTLKDRANQILQKLSTQVDGQGVFNDDTRGMFDEDFGSDAVAKTEQVDPGRGVFADDFSGAVTDSDTEFTFGKSNTERDQAQGFKNRDGARGLIEKLRKRFPSATDSTFGIREQADGTFLVVLDDSGQAEALRDDETVSQAIDSSRQSARTNPDRAGRQAQVQMKGVSGQTFLDVPTLMFAGRKLDSGDNQTVSQAFAAMIGRMLDRGIIGDDGFLALQKAFDKQYPGKEANAALASALKKENRIAQLRNALKDIPQATLDTAEGQRHIERQRAELAELEKTSTRDKDLNKTLADRADITEEQKLEGEPSAADLEEQLNQQAVDTKRRGAPTKTQAPAGPLQKNIDRLKKAIAGLPAPKDRTKAEQTEHAELVAQLKILQKNAPKKPGKKRTPKPKKSEVTAAKSRLAGAQKREEVAGRHLNTFDKDDNSPEAQKAEAAYTAALVAVKKATNALGTIERDAARQVPKTKMNNTKDFDTFIPDVSPKTLAAIEAIAKRVMKLLNKGTRIRIISAEGAQIMVNENHPHARYARMLMEHDSDFAIMTVPGSNMYYIKTDGFQEAGVSIAGLIHEFGHAIHFDTWEQLSQANQDALWAAFKAEVDSGKRTTGDFINRPGEDTVHPNAQYNAAEFKEWMADQFVDWMNNRRAPRNALERFLEAVAAKMDQLWAFINANPGRHGSLNETYGEFVDAVAVGLKTKDPTGRSQFFNNEVTGRLPIHVLRHGQTRATVPAGLARTEWNAVKERLTEQYPVIAARAKLISDWMHNAYSLAAAPSTSVMRSIAERAPAANKLVSIFNRGEHGKAKQSSNYHQRLKLMKGRFIEARYTEIVKNMTEAEKASLLKELRQEKEPRSRKAKEIRKLFDEAHKYMRDAKLPVGRIPNYFPRTYSREKLIANEAKILRQLAKRFNSELSEQQRAEDRVNNENTGLDMARKFFNSLISREADEAGALRELQRDELSMQSPSFRNMTSRTATDPFMSEYLDDNLDGIMGNYLTAVVKRAEFNRFLGADAPLGLIGGDVIAKRHWNSRGRVEAILKEARTQGATQQDLKMMKNYVDANLGMFGRDFVSDEFALKNPKTAAVLRENKERIRKTMAAVVAYNNMRVLMFTVFASLPDLAGPAIRSGSMRGAFRSTMDNISKIAKGNNELDDMARAWGIISSSTNQHIMTEYVDNHYMPATMRKWNEAFFKWTGLNYYTDTTRKMALAVGVDYLQTQAEKVNDSTLTQKQRDRAKQALKEFGLTDAEVNTWVAEGKQVWGGIGYETESKNDEKIAEALIQFVDESIMSPNASQRPILASHPAAMLVYHLKGFIYAIHDTILKRLKYNFDIADTPAQVMAAVAPAILMLALTAFGLELRELITGDNRTGRMDGWEYTWETMERSGLLGLSQLAVDFESAGARGQSEFVALGGPAISQLADLISKPISQTIPKAIPIVSQLPWARDALREATSL